MAQMYMYIDICIYIYLCIYIYHIQFQRSLQRLVIGI